MDNKGTGKGSDHSRINKPLFDAGWNHIFGNKKKDKKEEVESPETKETP